MELDYEHPLGRYVQVVDLDSGEEIQKVRWARESSGEIIALDMDPNGLPVIEPDPDRPGKLRCVTTLTRRNFEFRLRDDAPEHARRHFESIRESEAQEGKEEA